MKLPKLVLAVFLGATPCLSGRALAADETAVLKPVPVERSTLPLTAGRTADVPALGVVPGQELPADVQQLVIQFRTEAASFVETQRQLSRQIRGATEDEREKLKEQLKANRDKYLEESKALRADIRERVKELKEKLRESRPIDAGNAEGGSRRRRGGD